MRKWLLVVDDESECREVIKAHVELNFGDHVKIVEAVDGLDGTNKLPFQTFHCILTDLEMPRKEGLAFIQSIRESSLNQYTPVVVMAPSNVTQPANLVGVNWLHKPLDPNKIMQALEAQFKLGRTDQRVAAELLNAFIQSTTEFLNKVLKDDSVEQLPAEPKRQGESALGDLFRAITVRINKLNNTFIVGFPHDVLVQLAERAVQRGKGPSDPYKVIQTATQIILKYSLKKLGSQTLSNMVMLPAHKRGSEQHRAISNAKGIYIPLSTSLGTVHIYAIWEAVLESKQKNVS